MIKKPRTILEFDEVELYETSAIGIPSYAYAHKSFAKSLRNLFPRTGGSGLNLKELQNMSEEEEAKAKAEAEEKAKAEAEAAEAGDGEAGEEEAKAKEEAEAKAKAEAEAGEGAESEDNRGKNAKLDMTKTIADAIAEGMAKGIEMVQNQRGLADTKTSA